MLKNTKTSYGLITIAIHWIMAIAIIGTFALGLWMVELDYYSQWYKSAPNFHRSIGIVIFAALIFRFLWKLINVTPNAEPSLKTWEVKIASFVHYLLYVIVVVSVVTGYLISTADGRSVDVFGLFEIPATITGIDKQADRAGDLHYYLGVCLMVVAGIHALAALKHHFIDKNKTLSRMLGKK